MSEGPREGQLAVLAEHSPERMNREVQPEKVGNRDPRDPTFGKVKPGITFYCKDLWEGL
jgi:hypothetical protein